jgi:hypothetical protein
MMRQDGFAHSDRRSGACAWRCRLPSVPDEMAGIQTATVPGNLRPWSRLCDDLIWQLWRYQPRRLPEAIA